MIEKLKIKADYNLKNTLTYFLIYLSFFAITLSSFYSFEYNINIFYFFTLLLSCFLILFNFKKYLLEFRNAELILFFYLIPFFLSLISCYYYSIEINEIFFLKFIFILILGLNIYFLSTFVNFKNLITSFLFIHISFFLIELFSYYILKNQISFYEFFWRGGEPVGGPQLSSDNMQHWWDYIRIKRFTGLFNEPGTYSCIISILICSLMVQKKLSNIHWLVILVSTFTLILSASLRGILFFIIIISFLIFFERKNLLQIIRKNKLIFSLILLTFFYFLYFYLFNYLVARFKPLFLTEYEIILRNLHYNRSNLNFYLEANLIYKDLISKDIFFLLFGYGYGNESFSYNASKIYNDTGLYLYLLSRSGILFLLIFCLFIIRKIKNKAYAFMCLVIFGLSKLSFFNPIFLILFIAIEKRKIEN